jgi:ribosome-associated protein
MLLSVIPSVGDLELEHRMSVHGPVTVGHLLVVPADELEWRFDTSGGPGGQRANKAATRVELTWSIETSPSLTGEMRDRLLARLGPKAPGGRLTVSIDETRSQWRNRVIARRRMSELLSDAIRPVPQRRATKPTGAARRRRLEAKRRRGATKRLRRPPEPD